MAYVSHVGRDFQASEVIDHNEIITEDMSHITMYPGGLITKGIDIVWQLCGVRLHLRVWPNTVCLLWVSDGQQTQTCIWCSILGLLFDARAVNKTVFICWLKFGGSVLKRRWKCAIIYYEWHHTWVMALLSSSQFFDSSPVVLVLPLSPAGPSKITTSWWANILTCHGHLL